MTSCEGTDPIDNGNNTEQGGNENNGNENGGGQETPDPEGPATLTLGKVTAATAIFTGHLNVAASDLSFSQVTVYYSDAETFNMNSAQSVSATSFDKNQNFTITLTNLKCGTKYNYCMVAEVKSEKTYSDVFDFTTEDVTLSELSVISSCSKAEISGSVIGLSEEDKKYIEVGIIYSSETGKVDKGEGTKLAITEILSDNSVSFALSELSFGTIYYYCSYVKQGEVYLYGDVHYFTTENVILSSLSVLPSSYKAEVRGSVSGLSETDKECIKVGLIYSSEAGKVENGEGMHAMATEISSEGVFSIVLPYLTIETKYYYCGYLRQGDTYTYGTPAEFTTLKHPYELSYDLDVASAKDLSSSSSANCYIVSNPGLYKFEAVKGNSTESVGIVASASILWETCLKPCELVSGFCYKDGYIAFQTADTFKEGNAVIAAKDADGNILWSWHIWLTDEPQGQVYYNNAGTMMDRNLGATSATPGDAGALGLWYQWGRKDPFSTSSSTTITWPSVVGTNSSVGTVSYVIANPTTFVTAKYSPYDWHDSEVDNTLWTTSDKAKSIYDPCPSGWRVPDGGAHGVWSKALGSSSSSDVTYDRTNEGMNFSGKLGSASNIWYLTPGHRRGSDGKFVKNVGSEYGMCWSASPDGEKAYALYYSYSFDLSRSSISNSITNRANGLLVRCIKE